MGLQEAFIEKLFKDAMKQLKPTEIAKAVVSFFQEKLDALSGDADADGVVDKVEITQSLGVITQEIGKIAHVLEAVEKKKQKK